MVKWDGTGLVGMSNSLLSASTPLNRAVRAAKTCSTHHYNTHTLQYTHHPTAHQIPYSTHHYSTTTLQRTLQTVHVAHWTIQFSFRTLHMLLVRGDMLFGSMNLLASDCQLAV